MGISVSSSTHLRYYRKYVVSTIVRGHREKEDTEQLSFITWALSEKLDSVIVTVTGHTCSSLCCTIPNDLVPFLYARKRWDEPFGMFLHVEQHLLVG